MIIAIDFDGTLVKNKFPEIGEPNTFLIEKAKKWREFGHKLILWTCREDVVDDIPTYRKRLYLTEALNFCKAYGLEFDSVNKNINEENSAFHSRKIYADVYIDDKSCFIDVENNTIVYNKNFVSGDLC